MNNKFTSTHNNINNPSNPAPRIHHDLLLGSLDPNTTDQSSYSHTTHPHHNPHHPSYSQTTHPHPLPYSQPINPSPHLIPPGYNHQMNITPQQPKPPHISPPLVYMTTPSKYEDNKILPSEEITVGKTFQSKEEFILAINVFHTTIGRHCRQYIHDGYRIIYLCIEKIHFIKKNKNTLDQASHLCKSKFIGRKKCAQEKMRT